MFKEASFPGNLVKMIKIEKDVNWEEGGNPPSPRHELHREGGNPKTSGKITDFTAPAMPEASSSSALYRNGSRDFLMLFWTEYPCKTRSKLGLLS